MSAPRLGSQSEFDSMLHEADEPPEPSPLLRKIFDDMRGDDAEQDDQPKDSQKEKST